MEITIGVQHMAREITIESDLSADEVTAAVTTALASDVLTLVDQRGRRIIVPTKALGYVEIGAETRGRVGFSTI